jgi:DNA-directed RNA polymerase specialized sigma24 family protein
MNAAGSVTLYLRKLQEGDQAAIQKLWEGYFERLVGLARKKLQGAPRSVADEEDVALCAFDSFHRGVALGRFPRLVDRDDLWQVLVLLTVRKAAKLVRNARTAKAGGGRVRNASALDVPGEDEGRAFAELIAREPEPAFAAEVSDECRRLLGLLSDKLRAVALLKLEGHTNQEIAVQRGRSVVTVERWLGDIRAAWAKEAGKTNESAEA